MIDQGFLFRLPPQTQHGTVTVEFMNRAIEAEREACARVCDAFQARDVSMQPAECAGAIRARGQA
jgi:hypothetical protein